MKKLQKICIIFAFFIIALMGNCVNAASDFDLESLDFQATLNPNGDMQVVETWQIDINDTTNTLFKTFETDRTKYDSISNVTVKDVTANKQFEQIDSLMHHVTTDCYYGMRNNSGDFEIAWGVNRSSGRRTYEISYTVKNVMTVYSDCAELYWQFVGTDFEVPSQKVTGTITLPESVQTKENLRVWAHGPLNGEIQATSNNTVEFEISPFIADTYIEIRLAILEPSMFTTSTKTNSTNELDNIISEETNWANQANAKRDELKRNQTMMLWVGIIASAIIATFFIIQIRKNIQKIKETPKPAPTTELEYFREIPNSNTSNPSNASFLYYYNKTTLNTVMPKILSATMLDLALKKYIEFEVDTNKKKNEQVTVKLLDKDATQLRNSEKTIYDLLSKIGNSFTMKEFEKYAQKHNSTFLNTLTKIENEAQQENEEDKNYDKALRKIHDKYNGFGAAAFIALAVIAFFWLAVLEQSIIPVVIVTIPVVIYAFTCFDIAGRIPGLTQKGIDEKSQWEGLKKYMEDFSMLNEREVPELILWEKYMVYATAFGIADKVLKQLKVKYPEFSDDTYLSNTSYFYLIAHTDFNTSFVNSVSTSMQRAYQSSVASSSSSSGGGFGGGFSGGGGGRRPVVDGGGGR